jgi:hypothetical protein
MQPGPSRRSPTLHGRQPVADAQEICRVGTPPNF